MPEDSKHKAFRLMDLPVEVRCMIWTACLPSRVMEIDGGLWARSTRCDRTKTSSNNRRMPAIAQVCAESRAVAHEHGRWEPTTGRSARTWWSPERDVVFQHWHDGDKLYSWSGHDDAIPDLIQYSNGSVRGLGVVAERIRPFHSSANCRPDVQGPLTGWERDISQFRKRRDWQISMEMVALHISNEAGRRSGLFGLLGDAPIQLVDVDDVRQIARFHRLFASAGPGDLDPEANAFFSHLEDFQARVRVWRDELELVWVYNEWLKAARKRFPGVPRPWEIWLGPIDKSQKVNKLNPSALAVPCRGRQPMNIDLARFWLNYDHPFVRNSLADFPRFRLQVMFRHCTDDCHIQNRGKSSHWHCCNGDTRFCYRARPKELA